MFNYVINFRRVTHFGCACLKHKCITISLNELIFKQNCFGNTITLHFQELLTKKTVSVLGREEGYTVKYTPTPEEVPEGKARVNS